MRLPTMFNGAELFVLILLSGITAMLLSILAYIVVLMIKYCRENPNECHPTSGSTNADL